MKNKNKSEELNIAEMILAKISLIIKCAIIVTIGLFIIGKNLSITGNISTSIILISLCICIAMVLLLSLIRDVNICLDLGNVQFLQDNQIERKLLLSHKIGLRIYGVLFYVTLLTVVLCNSIWNTIFKFDITALSVYILIITFLVVFTARVYFILSDLIWTWDLYNIDITAEEGDEIVNEMGIKRRYRSNTWRTIFESLPHYVLNDKESIDHKIAIQWRGTNLAFIKKVLKLKSITAEDDCKVLWIQRKKNDTIVVSMGQYILIDIHRNIEVCDESIFHKYVLVNKSLYN